LGKMVALQNAPGISVNHEHGMLPGIEEDGIGGFGADAVNGEELLPENGGGRANIFVSEPWWAARRKRTKAFSLRAFWRK